jgi:hypothetical protein
VWDLEALRLQQCHDKIDREADDDDQTDNGFNHGALPSKSAESPGIEPEQREGADAQHQKNDVQHVCLQGLYCWRTIAPMKVKFRLGIWEPNIKKR